jgi:triacylglycerol lipase
MRNRVSVRRAVATAARGGACSRRYRPRVGHAGPARPQHPIVLAHGIFGFSEYFRGVVARLRRQGIVVYQPRLPALASVPQRARVLAQFIGSLPDERVNVVAHSMGGLDARYAVSHFNIADRVASVVSIGTPHRGTPVADLGATSLATAMRRVIAVAGITSAAVPWLTTAGTAAFNDQVPDVDGVVYGSIVATASRRVRALNPLLHPCYLYLYRRSGANDGLVPASSQHWGEILGHITADHLAQIGWSRRFDAGSFYEQLVTRLGERGL